MKRDHEILIVLILTSVVTVAFLFNLSNLSKEEQVNEKFEYYYLWVEGFNENNESVYLKCGYLDTFNNYFTLICPDRKSLIKTSYIEYDFFGNVGRDEWGYFIPELEEKD